MFLAKTSALRQLLARPVAFRGYAMKSETPEISFRAVGKKKEINDRILGKYHSLRKERLFKKPGTRQ